MYQRFYGLRELPFELTADPRYLYLTSRHREALSMSTDLLEEVRLLANIETASEKLLPLVLVGQPDLGRRLDTPELRQLKQRVALRCEITPLTLPETAAYMAYRIEKAGGAAIRLFTREAVMTIHQYSGGIPRTISV